MSDGDEANRWQGEFPYRWDEDDLVTRRDLLALTVGASGALFAVTALLAVVGRAVGRGPARAPELDLGPASALAVGEPRYFRYPTDEDEAMLLRLDGDRVVAWAQKCTHLSCSVYWKPDEQRIVCPCHDGVFDPATGVPVAGPPQRPLPRILLRRDGDRLVAVGREP